VQIALGGADLVMPHQFLDRMKIDAGFKQMGCERILSQAVNAALFGYAGTCFGTVIHFLCGLHVDWRGLVTSGKQPDCGMRGAPIQPQCIEQARRKQRVAILATLCVGELYVSVHP
jgi:hypothetical protein